MVQFVTRQLSERGMMVQNSDDNFSEFACKSPGEPVGEGLPELVLPSDFTLDAEEGNFQNQRVRSGFLLYIAIAFLVGVLITYAMSILINRDNPVEMSTGNASGVTATARENPSITVDVHGDVVQPGVYHLAADSRVMDAIRAAGGYVHKEDSQFVNQAQQLVDGQEIVVVPSDTAPANVQDIQSNVLQSEDEGGLQHSQNAKIDLNTADVSSLETIPDIGPKRASTIIEFRNEHGPFASIADLDQVKGFGKTTLTKIQPYLFVQQSH
jgi:competence protein ComEA